MIIFQLIQKPQLRGAEMFAAQLSEELTKNGNQVFLISLFPGSSILPFSGVHISLNRPIEKRWKDLEGWKELANLIDEYNPEIIQCNAGDTLKFAILSKKIYKWKTPVIVRNASMVSSYIKSPVTKWLNCFLYKNANLIISVSNLSAIDLNVLFPFTKSKTKVIPIGIDYHQSQNVDFNNSDQSSINVIHVGGFTFEKNHIGLLKIFKSFLQKKPNAHLHLLGEGPLKNQIHQLAFDLGIESNLSFYGWVSNPMDYIHKADVLVLPSIIEGLPGVLLEAMINNTIVVANNVGGIKEIIDHLQTGYLVNAHDEEAFVNAMVKAVSEDNSKIKIKAFELVEKKYLNANIALEFQKVYSEIIK